MSMLTQIARAPPDHNQFGANRPSLHRTQSWPPALSVSSTTPSILPISAVSNSSLKPTVNSSFGSSRTTFDSISTHSSTDTSLTSDISIEQKKEGFRATVSKRWVQTKHVLHEKAKLYREQHRARHRDKAIDSPNGASSSPTPDDIAPSDASAKTVDKKGLEKGDGHIETGKQNFSSKTISEKKNPEKQDTAHKEPEKKDLDARDPTQKGNDKGEASGKIVARKDPVNTKTEQSRRKGKVTNSPHELSMKFSQFEIDDRERGRQISGASLPAAFSSHGELLFDVHGQPKRKSRTSSGRRHSWREPSSGIVPVFEETESGKDSIVVDVDDRIRESGCRRTRGGRKSTM